MLTWFHDCNANRTGPCLLHARHLDAQLCAARQAHRIAEHRLATLLTEMAAGGGFRLLGYASVEQYAAAGLELTARVTRDLLRVGRALPNLPTLAASLAAGSLDWTKAREIVRIATPETEAAWVERAIRTNSRSIERDVAASPFGALPPDGASTPDAAPARRRVVFEMEAADAETLLQALALLRARGDIDRHEVEDGALLAALARAAIQRAESDDASPTGERYRVVLQSCPVCSATRAIPPALRRRVLHRAGWRCEVPNCRNKLWLDVHHTDPWATSRRHEFEKLMVVCCAHHRAIHEGQIAVQIDERGMVRVEHGDGRRFHRSRGPENPRGSEDPPNAGAGG